MSNLNNDNEQWQNSKDFRIVYTTVTIVFVSENVAKFSAFFPGGVENRKGYTNL